MTERDDLWDKLPGYVKIIIAIGVVWGAGATSAIAAQRFGGVPITLERHDRRITLLESQVNVQEDRVNRTFLYVGCKLEEVVSGQRARCELVLDPASAALLQTLRDIR